MKIFKSVLIVIMLLASMSVLFAQNVPQIYVTHTEFINNESAPSASTAANYVLFLENGQFKYKDSSGNVYILGGGALTEDKTVNFNNSMTASEIQALIDAVPKNLGGHTLTFQFADGTYTLNQPLNFSAFSCGSLNIFGNTSEANANELHTTQQVVLNCTSSSNTGIVLRGCHCNNITVRNLNILIAGGSFIASMYIQSCSEVYLWYNYFRASDKSLTYGALVVATFAHLMSNYVSNEHIGISSDRAMIVSQNNDDTGTAPNFGLFATNAGVIGKYDATQPAGTTANESTSCGGVIR